MAASLADALGPVLVAVAGFFRRNGGAFCADLNPGRYLIERCYRGVGLNENSPYFSERVTRPASGSADEIDLLRVDLPGGVSCIVPRVLYTEASGVFRIEQFRRKDRPTLRPITAARDWRR